MSVWLGLALWARHGSRSRSDKIKPRHPFSIPLLGHFILVHRVIELQARHGAASLRRRRRRRLPIALKDTMIYVAQLARRFCQPSTDSRCFWSVAQLEPERFDFHRLLRFANYVQWYWKQLRIVLFISRTFFPRSMTRIDVDENCERIGRIVNNYYNT